MTSLPDRPLRRHIFLGLEIALGLLILTAVFQRSTVVALPAAEGQPQIHGHVTLPSAVRAASPETTQPDQVTDGFTIYLPLIRR